MTILEHLAELRYRLIWSLSATGVAAVVGWFAFNPVVRLLLKPARPYLTGPSGGFLVFTSPTEAFVLRFEIAFYVGAAIALPVILFHFWRFVAPGLRAQEKRYIVPFVFAGVVLFAVGVAFAYTTLPQALRFLIGPAISGPYIRPLLTGKQFISFMLLYLAAFGVSFQFPVVLMFLTLARVITSRQMGVYRRHVLVATAIVVAVVTPTVDWYTMTVLTVALYLLYEGSIWLSRALRR